MGADADAQELTMQLSQMRDLLQCAVQLLEIAAPPMGDADWHQQRVDLIAGIKFEYFGGPEPSGEWHPY